MENGKASRWWSELPKHSYPSMTEGLRPVAQSMSASSVGQRVQRGARDRTHSRREQEKNQKNECEFHD